jgi:RES domain-containing protein
MAPPASFLKDEPGRWDDPNHEFGVLYTSLTRIGAILETLHGSFRHSPAHATRMAGIVRSAVGLQDTVLASGQVPRSWPAALNAAKLDIREAWLADLGRAESMAYLRQRLGTDVYAAITAGELLGPMRELTGRISRIAFEERNGGLRCVSSVDTYVENVSIFTDADGSPRNCRAISADVLDPGDPDLVEAMEQLGIAFSD